jgi:predicted transcriptional regulator
MKGYMKNFARMEQIRRAGQECGLPLFDEKPLKQKTAIEVTIPAHRKSIRSLNDVQRAALDRVSERFAEENARVLLLIAEEGPLCYHDVAEKTGIRVTSVTRILNHLRTRHHLIVAAYTADGPYGARVTFYDIDRLGLQRIADANVEEM